MIRKLEVIGEAVKHLSEDTRARRPEIPWKRIAGMRDRLTHHCFEIDLDLVWRVAERDLSPLRDAVGALLSGMSAGATRPTKNRLSSIWSARARERKI